MRICPLLLLVLFISMVFIPIGAAADTSATVVISGTVINPGSSNGAQGGASVGGTGQTGSSSNDYIPPPGPVPPAAAPPVPTFYGQGPVDTTPSGITREGVTITSLDHGASLFIPGGVQALDGSNIPLTQGSVSPAPGGGVPPSPDGTLQFTGISYDVDPAGTHFNPPATLTLVVPDSLWTGGDRFFILGYDLNAGSWAGIPTTLNSGARTVSGPVSRLGIFGLFAEPAPVPTPPLPIQPIPAGTVEVRGQPVQNPILNTLTGLLSYATANLSATYTSILIALAGTYAYTRRAEIARYRTWITLYLISMTGVLWASFVYAEGGPLSESVFIITSVTGLNLIVHILRFDRVVIPFPARVGTE